MSIGLFSLNSLCSQKCGTNHGPICSMMWKLEVNWIWDSELGLGFTSCIQQCKINNICKVTGSGLEGSEIILIISNKQREKENMLHKLCTVELDYEATTDNTAHA